MKISIDKEDLYGLIKKAVREVLQEEKLDFFLKNILSVSKEEMEDINKLYGRPSKDKEPAYSEIIEI